MDRIFHCISITLLAALFGCSEDSGSGTSVQAATDNSAASWREHQVQLGHETYVAVCAACHDEGKSAAPVIRQQDSWSDRSPLWSAVLFEHAKQGYLDMPARGGEPGLSDAEVEAAGEYMLSETFPELPRD